MSLQAIQILHTGRKMPVMGLGTWQLTKDTPGTIVTALQLGYRLIDTSGDYGTQPGIGEGLRRADIPRKDIFLCTKVEETDDAYEKTKQNLDELKVDFVDLILIHRPPQEGAGIDLWEGLIKARKEGLAKDIGVSNYSAELIDQLVDETGEMPVVNQIEWTPFGHSDAMSDHSKRHNVIIQAYSPLTRTKRLLDVRVVEIADKYDKSPAQILLRWNIERGTVPIPKASSLKHLQENGDIFDFELEMDDVTLLNSLNEYYSSLGTLPYLKQRLHF